MRQILARSTPHRAGRNCSRPRLQVGRLTLMQRWRTRIAVHSTDVSAARFVFTGGPTRGGASGGSFMADYAVNALGVPARMSCSKSAHERPGRASRTRSRSSSRAPSIRSRPAPSMPAEHASPSRSSRHRSQTVSIVPAITFPANSCWRSSYWRSMSGAGRGVSDGDEPWVPSTPPSRSAGARPPTTPRGRPW